MSFEERAAAADAQARTHLGHTIKVTMSGRVYEVLAHGNYDDSTIDALGSRGQKQDIEMMILKADLPTKPGRETRIRIPRRPGALFAPVNVDSDETDRHWLLKLKEVAI